MYQTFTFKADNTSDVLSFLAEGSPQGPPPFALLDGVTVTPEPAYLLPGLGLLALMIGIGVVRSKNRAKA
jgi:hypothetical protein